MFVFYKRGESNNKGFTLIELLVVISIIGMLSSVVMAGLTSARKKARATKFVSEMNQLKTAFELYRTDKGSYPFANLIGSAQGDDKSYSVISTSLSSGKGLKDELVTNKYISIIPVLSDCPTTCWSGTFGSGTIPEDYGYITLNGILSGPEYSCNNTNFKEYLFYACNNQISPNYPHLTGDSGNYSNCYCFGQ